MRSERSYPDGPKGKYNGPVQDFDGNWQDGTDFSLNSRDFNEPGTAVPSWTARQVQNWPDITTDFSNAHRRPDPINQAKNEQDA